MAIHIKGTFTPLGNSLLDKDPNGKFMGAGLHGLIIDLEQGTGTITAIKMLPDTPTLQAYLNDVAQTLPQDPAFETELANMYDTVQQLLNATKFLYGIYRLDAQTRMQTTYFWSLDRQTWHPIPDRRQKTWVASKVQEVLPDALMSNISVKLQTGWEPFMAFEHLHKGFDDQRNTRFQWINGSTAAEQGIKEFLVRLKSELEPLLSELASPPIPKLYKTILLAYTGVKSSYHKELDLGAQTRNKLVHTAGYPAPGYQETLEYLHTVECALLELHLLLEPKDPFMQYLYNAAQSRLQEVKTNPRSTFH